MVKVVLDTNVYISAILFGGKPERIINMARSGEIELLISPDILAEVARVLRGQKIKQTICFWHARWRAAPNTLFLVIPVTFSR